MGLNDIPNLKIIGGSPYLIHAEDRDKLKKRLVEVGIESGLGHRRNDLYTVFGGKRLNLPNMNKFENTYLLLPCRANMTIKEVDYICSKIKKFYGKR